MQKQEHIPVLAREVLNYLEPKTGGHYLDLTAGYGGHAELFLDSIGQNDQAFLVDRDSQAIDYLEKKFGNDKRVHIMHDDFLNASNRLLATDQKFNFILADLGLSSPHLDNASRGFSFMREGPLDMRMNQASGCTAATIVNTWSENELAKLLKQFGEVRGAHRLARAIIEARPLQNTTQLASLIQKSTKGYKSPQQKAQVFQALRIAVNEELKQLEQSLPLWHQLLEAGGRLGVISFHSLEDRLVKQYMKDQSGQRYDSELTLLTNQPVISTQNENILNPRARSAKLRVTQRK